MKNPILLFASCLLCQLVFAQHDHNPTGATTTATSHNHLAHMQASRAQNFYIHNLPSPKLMTGIGQSKMKIVTKSEKTQAYFNQGLNLLHDFWDFEAYRAFKEAIKFATLAHATVHGLANNVPAASGAQRFGILGKLVQPPRLAKL